MKKNIEYTNIDKSDLFSYLDWILFNNDNEITLAISDYIEKEYWKLYYSDLMLASDLMLEYIDYKELYDIDFLDDDWNVIDFSKWF
jgi:hypothetical protein